MIHIKLFLIVLMSLPLSLLAANGDTTIYRFQDKMDMKNYGNYDFKGRFPDAGKTYRQILMRYSLGCASSGCSGWDYTNHIQLLRPTGIFDSSVASIDTTNGKHDTTWKKTERIDKYELGRVITPYGTYMQAPGSNGYLPTWQHRYWFDVTDFASFLHDSATVRCVYSGYTSGFSATVEFLFIEGTPPRNVLKAENVWGSGGANCMGYAGSTQFETTQLPAKALSILPGTKSASFQFTPSGHGGNNNLNAAEFYDESADVLLNNTKIGRMRIWRDDCGKNPIYPQGGTWIYDRANWCPGTRVNTFSYDISAAQLHPGGTDSINVDFDPFTWTGSQTPCYAISSLFVQYGDNNFSNDVSIQHIIAPGNDENYRRLNPICNTPVIEIKNNGKNPVTSFTIVYGLKAGTQSTYKWSGNLPFNQSQQIQLPAINWTGATAGAMFEAEITSVNNTTDEWPSDNKMRSYISITPKHETDIIVWFKTNNFGTENKYKFIDWNGKTVFEKTSMPAANTIYKDTIHLAVGCYTFLVDDAGGDGMSWWANQSTAGSGYVYFRNLTGTITKSFPMDFGSEIRYNFTTAYLLGIENAVETTRGMQVYPNPASENITVEFMNTEGPHHIRLMDATGKVMVETTTSENKWIIPAKAYPKGMYLLQVTSGEKCYSEKIIID